MLLEHSQGNVMNILHIVLGLNIGGLERLVLDLVRFRSRDINPTILCLEKKGPLGEGINDIRIMELGKKDGFDWKLFTRIRDIAKEGRIDLIHTHNQAAHIYGSIAGLISGIPVVHTKHGRNRSEDRKATCLNRLCSMLSRKVVTVSVDSAQVSTVIENVPAHKVTTIHNGIDIDAFSSLSPSRSASPAVNIGIVARLVPDKDHLTLLRSCKILARDFSNFTLFLVGDGPLREGLQAAAVELGIARNVRFMGFRHDVATLLRSFDIFALSSVTEGLSLTLLEAMASGIPIVATDVGGNSEVVVHGKTGFIVPAQSPEAFADKLLLLSKDSKLRVQMGNAGRKRVEEKFNIRITAKRYEALYHEIINTRLWRHLALAAKSKH